MRILDHDVVSISRGQTCQRFLMTTPKSETVAARPASISILQQACLHEETVYRYLLSRSVADVLPIRLPHRPHQRVLLTSLKKHKLNCGVSLRFCRIAHKRHGLHRRRSSETIRFYVTLRDTTTVQRPCNGFTGYQTAVVVAGLGPPFTERWNFSHSEAPEEEDVTQPPVRTVRAIAHRRYTCRDFMCKLSVTLRRVGVDAWGFSSITGTAREDMNLP
jgi:hypothetical protein